MSLAIKNKGQSNPSEPLPPSIPIKKEDTTAAVLLEVFGKGKNRPLLPPRALNILGGYIPKEASLIETLTSPFPAFIKLTDRSVLKSHLASTLQHTFRVDEALEIAKRIYEAPPRSVGGGRYGLVFPADAEVLAYAMRFIKEQEGEVEVWEIGCASGENGMLLAYAGAKSVSFNDIDKTELGDLVTRIKKLHPAVASKCAVYSGSCLELLKMQPQFVNSAGLILCRNVLHFFKEKEIHSFLETTKQLLKVGGQAIFTVNSIYPAQITAQEAQADMCDGSAFQLQTCDIFEYEESTTSAVPCGSLCSSLTPCKEELVRAESRKEFYVYRRDITTNNKWAFDKQGFGSLDRQMKDKIKASLQTHSKEIAKIKKGAIKVISTNIRMFNPNSLSKLFERHEFEIKATFVVDRQGHLIHDLYSDTVFKKGQQMGIVVSKKGQS